MSVIQSDWLKSKYCLCQDICRDWGEVVVADIDTFQCEVLTACHLVEDGLSLVRSEFCVFKIQSNVVQSDQGICQNVRGRDGREISVPKPTATIANSSVRQWVCHQSNLNRGREHKYYAKWLALLYSTTLFQLQRTTSHNMIIWSHTRRKVELTNFAKL